MGKQLRCGGISAKSEVAFSRNFVDGCREHTGGAHRAAEISKIPKFQNTAGRRRAPKSQNAASHVSITSQGPQIPKNPYLGPAQNPRDTPIAPPPCVPPWIVCLVSSASDRKQPSGPGAPPLTFYGGVGRRNQRRGDVGTEGRRRNPCAHALMWFAYRRHAAERSASSEQKWRESRARG